jgi:aspartyl-tRNA(Asn)/glutamyl-tRNA(Gln) amidotransferase subunit A
VICTRLTDRRTVSSREFEGIDVLLLPITVTRVPTVDDARSLQTLSLANTMFVNYLGLPAINVPCGFDRYGLTIGLQIVGKSWDDVEVLRLGHQYHMLDAAHQKTPIP